jgi:hypothetical protein
LCVDKIDPILCGCRIPEIRCGFIGWEFPDTGAVGLYDTDIVMQVISIGKSDGEGGEN